MPYNEVMAPKKRHFDPLDTQQLLAALAVTRRGCVQATRKAPIRGEVYLAAEKVIEAIDDAAFVLTGRRDHFWLRQH